MIVAEFEACLLNIGTPMTATVCQERTRKQVRQDAREQRNVLVQELGKIDLHTITANLPYNALFIAQNE